MSEFVIPKSGLIPAPEVEQPNIFPMEWRVETPKLAEIYERAKCEGYNPSMLGWDSFEANDYTRDQRVAMMYWFALLSNFDASGPAVFAKATIHAFERHEENPVRQCFFSITRDEMNHEETCGRIITKLVPGGPVDWEPRTELERVAYNNIKWLYHNGGRYWTGYSNSLGKYPLAILFTSFMMGEVASSTLFHGMSRASTHPLYQDMFRKIGLDESRHLQICITLLEKDWPGLNDEYRAFVTRQLRAGFVFLSMILWEPPNQFWDLQSVRGPPCARYSAARDGSPENIPGVPRTGSAAPIKSSTGTRNRREVAVAANRDTHRLAPANLFPVPRLCRFEDGAIRRGPILRNS